MANSTIPPWFQQVPYIFEPGHQLISSNGEHGTTSNICDDGANLTIMFLSLDRVHLSIRLLESLANNIPNFNGNILIADNGSTKASLATLKSYLANYPLRFEILEFGENLGVAGGRNRASERVSTEWVMSLDNDIYFIGNPLPTLRHEISTTGSHFINLPLLNDDESSVYSSGGHLYVGHLEEHPSLGGGGITLDGTLAENIAPLTLGTFLFGGASIFKLESFTRLGKFDENFFIGFEDTDFSISIFNAGMKIASSTALLFVHAHEAPQNTTDQEYERTRFSRNVIEKSGQYFERKHGFKVFNSATESWLNQRWQDLKLGIPTQGVEEVIPEKQTQIINNLKPKIALITDVENWAFANIATQIEKHLSDKFEICTIPAANLENLLDIWLLTETHDLVHFFWGNHILNSLHWSQTIEAKTFGLSDEQFKERFIAPKKITMGIYDHLHLSSEEINNRSELFNEILAGYSVSSNILNSIYSSIDAIPGPTIVIQDGVDTDLFQPTSGKFDDINLRPLRIGWVGNSNWSIELEDFKGYNTILKPVIDEIESEREEIDFFLADRAKAQIPHSKMPNFYENIDVLICTSLIEGTPNPVLEAMASGCAIISTEVGIIPEVFGPKQKGWILEKRNIENLKKLILEMAQNRKLLKELAEENLLQVKKWSWKLQTKKFETFFNYILEK